MVNGECAHTERFLRAGSMVNGLWAMGYGQWQRLPDSSFSVSYFLLISTPLLVA
jgi:hypothetical protein